MSYTVEDIVLSANTLNPKQKLTPDSRLARELINDGLSEIQRKTGWYRLRANVTCTADQNYVEWITGAADHLDMIKLINVYSGNEEQYLTTPEKIKLLRDQNAVLRDTNGTLERVFAMNLHPDNATFGTVHIELWPTYTSNTTVIAEYETRPPAVTTNASTVNVPRECMLYYLAWRLALMADDDKRVVLFMQKLDEMCERVRRAKVVTKTKHREPHYGPVFYDIRQSRRHK